MIGNEVLFWLMEENKMKRKTYQVIIPINIAIKNGFKATEKEAKARLKAMYPKNKWVGAEIVADTDGTSLIYTME